MQHSEMPAEQFEWCNSRGNTLACYAFIPPVPRAVLVYHHGFGEYTQRKFAVFEQLSASGIAVYTFDMFGHGISEPTKPADRAWVQNWQHMVDDLCDFAQFAHKRHTASDLPASHNWFLGGYSIGGLVAVHAVLRHPHHQQQQQEAIPWKGIVLISAALGLHRHGLITHIQSGIAPLLNATLPRQKIVKAMKTAHLNPDPAWVAEYDADPLCYHGKFYVGTVYQFIKAQKMLEKRQHEFKLPALIIHSTGDRITDHQVVQDLAANLTDVDVDTIEGGYHDVLSKGPLQQRCLSRITTWINQRSGVAAEARLPH